MYILVIILHVAFAEALTKVQEQCIAENREELSNDYLLGSWYQMYRFNLSEPLDSSPLCTEISFSKPTKEEIEEYVAKYNHTDLPSSLINDNPVIRNDGFWIGMVTGKHLAKFYILDPKESAVLSGGFQVTVFRPLNNDYFLWQDCARTEHTSSLFARDRFAPVDEMEELISNTPELASSEQHRFCATY